MSSIKSSYLRNAFFIILVALVVLNIFIYPHHPHFGLEKYTGFWAVFGFGVAVILAKVAKGCAHTFLGKDEDSYLNMNEIAELADLDQHHQEHH